MQRFFDARDEIPFLNSFILLKKTFLFMYTNCFSVIVLLILRIFFNPLHKIYFIYHAKNSDDLSYSFTIFYYDGLSDGLILSSHSLRFNA